jgi:hypothetical protein
LVFAGFRPSNEGGEITVRADRKTKRRSGSKPEGISESIIALQDLTTSSECDIASLDDILYQCGIRRISTTAFSPRAHPPRTWPEDPVHPVNFGFHGCMGGTSMHHQDLACMGRCQVPIAAEAHCWDDLTGEGVSRPHDVKLT